MNPRQHALLFSLVGMLLISCDLSLAQTNQVNGNLFTLTGSSTAPNGVWSWFQDERAIVDWSNPANPRLIVSSVSAATSGVERGDVDILWRNLNTGAQGEFELSNQLEQDDHNSAAIFQRSDGRYVAMYSRHGTDNFTRWRVSTNPNDPTSWGAENTLNNGAGTTYNNVYHLPNDNNGSGITYNFTRSTNYDPNVQVSYDNGSTWSNAGKLLTEGGSTDRPYLRYAASREKIFFLTTERHPRNFANSVYAGYVQNGVLHRMDGSVADNSVFDANGVAPSTLSRVFQNGSQFNGNTLNRAWTINLEVDKAGNPAGIISARVNDSDQDHRFLYARYDGIEWHVNEIARAGGFLYSAENDYTGLASIDPDNPNVLYMSTDIDPRNGSGTNKYELYKGVTSDFGKTWSWTAITENSTVDNLRPVVPKWNGENTAVTWMRGNYTTYLNWDTQVVGINFADTDPKALNWRGDASSSTTAWDNNSTANWDSGGGLSNRFNAGDEVTFDDSAVSTTVNLQSMVTPMSVAFANQNKAYQLNGGGIAGSGGLRVIGGGTVTLTNTANTYSGNTVVGRGTLALAGTTQLTGSPQIRVAQSGVLDVTAMNTGAYSLVGQTLINEGTVRGNINATQNSTVQLNSSQIFQGNLTLANSRLQAAGSTITGDLNSTGGSIVQIGNDGMSQSTLISHSYVDATHGTGGNTTLANGATFNPTSSSSGANASNWILRSGLANGGTVYQGGADAPGTLPSLKTTLSGFTPGQSYRMFVNFWDATSSSWQIRAGAAADQLQLFSSPLDNIAGAVDGIDPSQLNFAVAPLINEGNRQMWAGELGVYTADSAGQISVIIDDTGTGNGDDRTWYDGLTFEQSTEQFTGHSNLVVAGNFYMDPTSSLLMDIGDSLHLDRLLVSGNASFGGTLIIKAAVGAGDFQLGDRFDLFDFASATGEFNSLVLPSLSSGLTWDIGQLYSQGVLQVTAVPEPGMFGVLAAISISAGLLRIRTSQ